MPSAINAEQNLFFYVPIKSYYMLHIDNIHKKYGNSHAVRGISFRVSKGEVVGLMGANGSGKSTILRVIAGIYAPDEGSVRVRGRVTLLAGIGTGFQLDLTGRENIMLTGSIYGYSKMEISKMAEAQDKLDTVNQLLNEKEFLQD